MEDKKYPYFQFSKLCTTSKALVPWLNHFKKKNVACVIVKEGKLKFSLWRGGKEASDLVANVKPLRGEIVMKFDPEGVFTGIKPDHKDASSLSS